METPKIFRRSKKAALPPGTLVHVGEKGPAPTRVSLTEYDDSRLSEKKTAGLDECLASAAGPLTTWIDVSGLHDTELVEELGRRFDIHPLVLEDIVHTGQRPKVEDHGSLLFLVAVMLRYVREKDELAAEQVSIILGKGYVISFQEGGDDLFEPVRERLRRHRGHIRARGADYLAYTLLDTVVDNYFLVLEQVGEKIEEIEEEITVNAGPASLQDLHDLRRGAIVIRKSVWPLRDVVAQLERGGSKLFGRSTAPYLRDVYDHTVRVIETVETYRDLITGLLDLYLSGVSNRMNEVMKTLTIIATIFIPLTFIAGVYGMNFDYMPELRWRWGYFGVLAVMAVVGLLLLFAFRRRRWL